MSRLAAVEITVLVTLVSLERVDAAFGLGSARCSGSPVRAVPAPEPSAADRAPGEVVQRR
jgi:hypothetical protein